MINIYVVLKDGSRRKIYRKKPRHYMVDWSFNKLVKYISNVLWFHSIDVNDICLFLLEDGIHTIQIYKNCRISF